MNTKKVAIVILVLMLAGCGTLIDDENVKKAVEKQGYSSVEILEKNIFFVDWRGCGDDDDAHFSMLATNARGNRVTISACAGWPFKGVTVRTK